MKEFEDELTSDEADALQKLAKEKQPPAFVESRIIDALREAQLIQNSWFEWRRRSVLTGLALAVLVSIFGVGVVFGSWWSSASAKTRDLPRFMLVLRNTPRLLAAPTDDERLQRVAEYSTWAKGMSQKGVVIDGEKLNDEAHMLSVVDGRPVVSNSQQNPNDAAIAGYFLIYARDYREAVGIAENCPHLKYGGTIEVRQIDSPTKAAH